MRRSFLYLVIVVCLLGMVGLMDSCKPALPSGVLSKGKMTDILYDYHLALAMAHTQEGGDRGQSLAYRQAVLKKHDVTSAEFDSSMVYYMRHTEMLEDVYKDLGDRLNSEMIALGGNGGMGQFDNLSATGDTANVWNLTTSLVLSTQQPFNEYSFNLEVDSAYHKGDRLMLDFETQFIFQDGMRDGIALLAVQFANDSVAQSVVHLSSSQHYSIQVADNDSLGIKGVKGYFMLSDGGYSTEDASATTLKLMFVENIKLIRMHPQKSNPVNPTESSDSSKRDSATLKADSVKTHTLPSGEPARPLPPPGGPNRPIELVDGNKMPR